jgi:hypothetical protein
MYPKPKIHTLLNVFWGVKCWLLKQISAGMTFYEPLIHGVKCGLRRYPKGRYGVNYELPYLRA